MSPFEARKKAIELGAHYRGVIVEKRRNAFGIEKEIVHDFIEYYFSFDKKEIGYYSAPTKSFCVISREWSPNIFASIRLTVLDKE